MKSFSVNTNFVIQLYVVILVSLKAHVITETLKKLSMLQPQVSNTRFMACILNKIPLICTHFYCWQQLFLFILFSAY